MKFMITSVNHDLDEEQARRFLAAFVRWEAPPSVTLREMLISADARTSFLVVEADDALTIHHELANFYTYANYTVHPVVDVLADGERVIAAYTDAIAFRDATP